MSDRKLPTKLKWFKSSYSGNNSDTTDCVEVAFDPDGQGAYLRDSKDPQGGSFYVPASTWASLLAVARKIDVPPAE